MIEPLKLAVAGLGTVGTLVLKVLRDHSDLLTDRGGRRIIVSAVSARDRRRDRGIDLSTVRWYQDAVAMAADPEVDVVAELIGGADGVARNVCETAIKHHKHVITANKALLAVHGATLARDAEMAGVGLAFEAAVAGGIPVVKGIREGLAADQLNAVFGILNGTCNFILSEMTGSGSEFNEVLAEAQRRGYAETNPAFDIDGIDAAHKLAILAGLAFNGIIDFSSIYIEGIRHVSALDIAYAAELGYRIKLLGLARRNTVGIELRVHPCMVPAESPIAAVNGVFNAVVAQGEPIGQVMMVGHGAGGGPTASAVIADLLDIARGCQVPPLGIPGRLLPVLSTMPMEHRFGAYYLRLMVVDRPGVIADITAHMRDEAISVESILQRGRSPDDAVPVVITTHETYEENMLQALTAISRLDSVLETPRLIRIETLLA